MKQSNLDDLTRQIAALTGTLTVFLKELKAGGTSATKEALVEKITETLKKVPKSKLQSAYDYITFLATFTGGGGEDDAEGQG